jgi:diamine N-acetyltransferase
MLRSPASLMTSRPATFVYRELSADRLDEIQPLWEKLNAHHAAIAGPFRDDIRLRTFAARKAELLAKAGVGMLRVEIASVGAGGPGVAYSIGTISEDRVGEIDSLFVDDGYRGRGVGTELTRRAIAWLDEMKVAAKVVSVLSGNDEALAFYQRFDFHPRTTVLQTIQGESRDG